jgi:hypothetical protein
VTTRERPDLHDPIPEPTVPPAVQTGRAGAPEDPAKSVTAPAATAPSARECPHCGATSVGDAMFCEGCGFDFVTSAAPLEPAGGRRHRTSEQSLQPHEVYTTGHHGDAAQEAAEVLRQARVRRPDDDVDLPTAPEVPPPTPPTQERATPAHEVLEHLPPSRDHDTAWVVEVWVDRGWYDRQESDQPCPAPTAPLVVPVRGSSLVVGRTSDSLGVRPEVEAGQDLGVSRRHAQLTTDGRRFWVRDLGTPNGTFVGTVGDPLPREPVGRDVQVEVGRDDRVYVGTWTRLVLRPAADRERPAQPGDAS